MAAVGVCQQSGLTLGHPAPVAGHVCPFRITIPQHNEELTRGQRHPSVRRRGPPREASLRESLHTEPVALPIIAQEFERRARAVAKHVDGARQGILAEDLPTHGTEPIDAFPEIDGVRRHKNTTLGGELEHERISRKARTNVSSGNVDSAP